MCNMIDCVVVKLKPEKSHDIRDIRDNCITMELDGFTFQSNTIMYNNYYTGQTFKT